MQMTTVAIWTVPITPHPPTNSADKLGFTPRPINIHCGMPEHRIDQYDNMISRMCKQTTKLRRVGRN